MKQTKKLNKPSQIARDKGIAKAVDHANAVRTNWSLEAYKHFCKFAQNTKRRRRRTFLTEEARQYAERQGLPPPPDGRAWGGITVKLARDKLIGSVGYAQQQSPNCHGSPKSLWIAL